MNLKEEPKVHVILRDGRIIGKTKLDRSQFGDFEVVEFDATNADHKKAKFLTEVPAIKERVKVEKNFETGYEWFLKLSKHHCHFQTTEGKGAGVASNSELRRWIENKVVLVNHFPLEIDEPMDFQIFSVVLFPNNSKRKCTLL